MTTDLKSQFEQAGEDVKHLSERPDNEAMLKLYALFKQGTQGDNTGARPGFTDFVGRAKYDAWKEFAGLSKEDAMSKYIELVNSLKEADKKT